MASIPFCAVPASLILFMPRPIPQWGKEMAGDLAGEFTDGDVDVAEFLYREGVEQHSPL